MAILIKGNPKRGIYKLIPTTDGYVLDGIDGDFMTYAGYEVVPCGECKWWDRDHKTESKGLCERNICGFTEPTDFCSFGERRNDEHI